MVLDSGTIVHLPPGQVIDPRPVEIEGTLTAAMLGDALAIAVTEQDDVVIRPDDSPGEAAEVAQPAEEPADRNPTSARPHRQTSI